MSYAEPFQRLLSCVTRVKILRAVVKDLESGIAISPCPARLEGSDYQIFFAQSFRYIEEGVGTWRIKTTSYTYAVEVAATKQEVVAFHWEGLEKGKVPYPHLHLGYATKNGSPYLSPKAHVPTGRVSFEDVVAFIVSDLKVKPLKEDWQEIIQEERANFMSIKSW